MTTLDLNMGFRISPASQYMTSVVTQIWKFEYNCLPMGMYALEYILQDKVDKLICDIDGIKTFIDDILVLRKEILYKHIEQLWIIFCRLRAAGLKANNPKCSFWLK